MREADRTFEPVRCTAGWGVAAPTSTHPHLTRFGCLNQFDSGKEHKHTKHAKVCQIRGSIAVGKKGRAPKFNQEAAQIILAAVADGVPDKYAARKAGIGERTLARWKSLGRQQKKNEYTAFVAALKKAQSQRVAASVERIQAASRGGFVVETTTVTTTNSKGVTVTRTHEKRLPPQWTADAWFLERRHADEFASNKREVKELREQLAAILKVLASGKFQATDTGSPVVPKVGGEADPNAV